MNMLLSRPAVSDRPLDCAARLLLVDEDERLASAVCGALSRRGYRVEYAGTAADAMRARPVDLIVLDPRLSGGGGRRLYRSLRARSEAGIIIATWWGGERPWAVDAGDDYIVKPFGLADLEARLQASLRRRLPRGQPPVVLGTLRVDVGHAQAWLDGTPLDLTHKQFRLLALLAETPCLVVPRQRLVSEVWQAASLGSSRTLDVHVAVLRSRLSPLLGVENVRGVGYRLVGPAMARSC